MDIRCFYGTLVNGLLDVVATRLDDAARQRLRARGLDPDVRQDFYPAAIFYDAVPVIAAAVFPGLPPEEAERRLGAAVVEGYLAGHVGRVMSGFFVGIGTRDALLDADAFYRSGQNFLRIRSELVGERIVRLRIAGTGGHARLYQGIIEAAHHVAGEAGLRVALVEEGADHAVLEATW